MPLRDRIEFTSEQISECMAMRRSGARFKDIAAHFGVSVTFVAFTFKSMQSRDLDLIREKQQKIWSQLPEATFDTRNLTARMCGDPLPGRSALDVRLAEVIPHTIVPPVSEFLVSA